MDNKLTAAISAAPDNVLADIVKLAQKQGRQGTKGGWKEFLKTYDRKFGSSLSDPSKRSRDSLISFLNTFTDEDLKFVDNVLSSYANFELMKQIIDEAGDNTSSEQRLVHLTLKHPQFRSKYSFPSYDKDWVVTKIRKKSKLMKMNKMLAIDCEMVLCEDGTDAVVKVCVVDSNLQVKLDEMVNPYKPVADYRTEITGVAAGDLDGVSCSLADIQKSMKKLLSKGAILVGHSLYNDLLALKLEHVRVVDTSFLFKTSDGNTPSLNNLCKWVLGYALRKEGCAHNCLDDARAAMKLVLAKIEHGVDSDIPLIQAEAKDVSETEMAKLLIHKIPVFVHCKDLRRVFPGNLTFELELHKKAQGAKQYSVVAIFKNPQEAQLAFENLDGSLEKDTSGRPQKLITFQLNNKGESTQLFVRQMVQDYSLHKDSLKKRAYVGENSGDPKKQKRENSGDFRKLNMEECDHLKEIQRLKQELKEMNLIQCDDHFKEIEKLKQDIRAKDLLVSTQDKIITDLKRKLEELKKDKKKGR